MSNLIHLKLKITVTILFRDMKNIHTCKYRIDFIINFETPLFSIPVC